ncbi:2-hydroxyacid dehydrogenase [Hoeflea ulvae]|uniref:C-terminal binding protein n=1 Tax=Hoeflea ulvae TaxID=2983764 RepID=A0ABT3YG66_9HYPH|nr:C-terminal binding protein [Hoeflea ulvae]MCY0094797.1 C-terminal binding protein [Hoeflea ulvae]
MKIIRTDSELQTPHVDTALREQGHDLTLLPDGVSEAELTDAVRDADLILMCYTPITRRILEAAPRLKGIVKYGVGIDAIDIPAAIEHGIPVVNIPEYAEETVAEGAFALMIALARKMQPLGRAMQRDGWAWPEQRWLASDIAGKTVGIVGLGKIGKSFARMAGAGFRANVIAYNPGMSDAEFAAAGAAKREDLRQLLSESDFVSLHCTLNATTRGLIGEAELKAMKPSAYLINTSRGALVDEAALLRALEEAWIAGAGLDVFADEPLKRSGHPLSQLFALEQVIVSPHLTFYTEDAMRRLEHETLERCSEILSGKPTLVKSHDPRLRAQRKGVMFG